MGNDSRIKQFLVATLMPFLLIVLSFGSEDTLLCFGKDGHVAVEFVDACNGTGLGSQFEGMKDDACGPCKDVQFLSSLAHTRNNSQYAQSFPLTSQSQISPSLPLKEYSYRHVNLSDYAHHKTLARLHSVVLLI